MFHFECIARWMLQAARVNRACCPLCRTQVEDLQLLGTKDILKIKQQDLQFSNCFCKKGCQHIILLLRTFDYICVASFAWCQYANLSRNTEIRDGTTQVICTQHQGQRQLRHQSCKDGMVRDGGKLSKSCSKGSKKRTGPDSGCFKS